MRISTPIARRLGALAALAACGLTPLATGTAQPRPLVPSHIRPSASAAPRGQYPQITFWATNAVLGGLSAGLRAPKPPHGQSHWKARLRAAGVGAAGGLLVSGGHRILGDTSVPPIVGAYTAALGVSISRNAALGQAPLSEIMLPMSPLWVTIETGWGSDRPPAMRAALSVPQLVSMVEWGMHDGMRARPDWGSTVRSGSLILRAQTGVLGMNAELAQQCLRLEPTCPDPMPRGAVGRYRAGAIIVAQEVTQSHWRSREWTLRHELVHQSQGHRDRALLTDPLIAAIPLRAGWAQPLLRTPSLPSSGPRATPPKRFDVLWNDGPGLLFVLDDLIGPLGGPRPRTDRWSEREAEAALGADGCGYRMWTCRRP